MTSANVTATTTASATDASKRQPLRTHRGPIGLVLKQVHIQDSVSRVRLGRGNIAKTARKRRKSKSKQTSKFVCTCEWAETIMQKLLKNAEKAKASKQGSSYARQYQLRVIGQRQ